MKVKVGNTFIGDGYIPIQSMTTTDTANCEATIEQILRLEAEGCEIVRVATYDINSAKCIKKIKDGCNIPVVADVHFDYKIAVAAIEAGADKVRINPGNIGDKTKIKYVVDAAKFAKIPIRVGANTGSLMNEYKNKEKSEALVCSALANIEILEDMEFYDIVVSLKSSNAVDTIKAYRSMARMRPYPLHLGVTEAGDYESSIVKSSIGIGCLLAEGIGDTLRVSVTGDPVQEIPIAKDILRFSGVRSFGAEVISCPTCARCHIDLSSLTKQVKTLAKNLVKPIKIAVMGCPVNGPGEAKDAHVGVAGGDGLGILFSKGKIVKKVPESEILGELGILIDKVLAEEF